MTVHGRCQEQTGLYKSQVSAFAPDRR